MSSSDTGAGETTGNATKDRLRAGESVFGCFLKYPDPGIVELVGLQGFDFLVFDGEHGPISPRECEHMVRAAECRNVTPIVRVPVNEPSTILGFMDTGAQGLHIPMVDTADAADAGVQSVKFGPRGRRGLAGSRAASYGQGVPMGQYTAAANEATLVVVHVETEQAVTQSAAIGAVDGVDVVFIGPNDLSQSLGHPGDFSNPDVQRAFDAVIDAVNQTAAVIGVLVTSAEDARAWEARGARYLVIGIEPLLRASMRTYLAEVRSN